MNRLPQVAASVLLVVSTSGHAAPRAVDVDVDCDGRPDRVVVLSRATEVVVRVIYGHRARPPAVLRFPIGASQDAFCATPVTVVAESLDYDPTEAVGPVDGFVQSKTCKGFVLSDDRCDSIHFFWNHRTKRISWWRA